MASNIPHAARVATGLVGVAKSANPQTVRLLLKKRTRYVMLWFVVVFEVVENGKGWMG